MSKKKILIADPSSITLREIFKSDEAKNYEIETACSGPECLEKVESMRPDLIFIELLLPKIHGIELLKILKTDPSYAKIGVVMTSSLRMQQNYNAAVEFGACYFLCKPFSNQTFFAVAKKFFEQTLSLDPLEPFEKKFDLPVFFERAHGTMKNYLKFWGTRGSSPVSGSKYLQFGGNTCCLEINYEDCFLIIDAGSGIRELGEHLHIGDRKKISILLGHTHWDHIIGFPFFSPVYDEDFEVEIYSPIGYQKEAETLFNDMLAYGYFPIRLDEMKASLSFKELRDRAVLDFGQVKIECHYASHPGPTLCFKIRTPTKTIGYVSDNEIFCGFHGTIEQIVSNPYLLSEYKSLMDFLDECDVVVHEAQYFNKEYSLKCGWGHSSITNATALIKLLKNCKEWIVTHHDPRHSDEDLIEKTQVQEKLLAEENIHVKLKMAYDGLCYPL
jgi:CheY-like chemotaxis protein